MVNYYLLDLEGKCTSYVIEYKKFSTIQKLRNQTHGYIIYQIIIRNVIVTKNKMIKLHVCTVVNILTTHVIVYCSSQILPEIYE